ncbi:hypothetical protein PoB_002346400 [Plakobranchus ocellatus]|uniref:Uncharacterized protein n=1 Tax=Plakobranchus ocellatus TaxID=259542 RepID=A0AAV3ZNS0_9GAST|nr:hypothetical protein PoB_002346400 [Plakobranchus ocellatus]
MTVDFESLTVKTGLTPLANVTPHAMPHEALRNGLLCWPNTRVRERPWILLKTGRVKGVGCTDHGAPVEVSQSSVDDPMSTSLSTRPVVAVRYEAISSELTWSLARRSKLMQSLQEDLWLES